MMNNQKGSSMLIVVMIISVITVIAVSSMRSALTGKEQVVNALIDHILDAENVTTIAHITSLNKGSTSNNSIHTKANDNAGEEWVFCTLANRANNYSASSSSVMRWVSNAPNNGKIGTNGYCKTNDTAMFRSDRKATLTQVAVRKTSQSASDFTGGAVTSGTVYVITATTLMPKLSTASHDQMNACLNNKVNNMTMVTGPGGDAANRKPVVECLRDLGVPVRAATHTYVR